MNTAIILAGGFGTRLRHILPDVPKPMADINGKPFLEYILLDLLKNGIQTGILATGYKREVIKEYFGSAYCGMELLYSEETTPLLTGGAIKKALSLTGEQQVFVINGDTYFSPDLQAMRESYFEKEAELMVASKLMFDFERYGTLETDINNRILCFQEKKPMRQGYINGGVYLMDRGLLDHIDQTAFSFESDFMEKEVARRQFFSFPSDGYFIDIGVPEDYDKARREMNFCL